MYWSEDFRNKKSQNEQDVLLWLLELFLIFANYSEVFEFLLI